VLTALDQASAGIDDSFVAELVRRENRTLVILDSGFADIRAHAPGQYAGIVVLRPARADVGNVLDLIVGQAARRGARSARFSVARPNSRRTRLNAARVTALGVVISIPIGLPVRLKSTTMPGSTRIVR